jgi:hypothetical protein
MMASKFGFTVTNCMQPILAESFDLVTTMEAFDTHPNLKDAIFHIQRICTSCIAS